MGGYGIMADNKYPILEKEADIQHKINMEEIRMIEDGMDKDIGSPINLMLDEMVDDLEWTLENLISYIYCAQEHYNEKDLEQAKKLQKKYFGEKL